MVQVAFQIELQAMVVCGRFVKAAAEINEGKATAADFDVDLPTGENILHPTYLFIGGCLLLQKCLTLQEVAWLKLDENLIKLDENFCKVWNSWFTFSASADLSGRVTEAVTAILEAGRRSLDNNGATVKILYQPEDWQKIADLKVVA